MVATFSDNFIGALVKRGILGVIQLIYLYTTRNLMISFFDTVIARMILHMRFTFSFML